MSNEGFCVNLETAALFFRYCRRYDVKTQSEKIIVMRRLVAKNKAKYIRDAKSYLNQFNVIKIDGKEPPEC